MFSRLAILGIVACGSPAPHVELTMDFRRASFYDAPFPSDDVTDLSGFPDPDQPALMEQARALLAGSGAGFARTGAIYFHATAALDPASLPDLPGSIAGDASAYVVAIDPASPAFMRKQPVVAAFLPDGGPYGAKNLLALLPLQGAPLLPSTRYAAVVTTRVHAANGEALAPSQTMSALAQGQQSGEYHDAVATLRDAGVDPHSLAALAVFTTADPTAGLALGRAALPAPLALASPPAFVEAFPDYCVYASTIAMPVLQTGTPPYMTEGGAWANPPVVDHVESARVVLTIPRAAAPAAGYPLVVFVRTGGGGDRPLVDRGQCATPEFTTPITPGSGPAREFARVGFAGAQVDGPLGGARNTTGADEQFLIFNVQNPGALRDNIRESAVELAWLPDALANVSIDASACTGASTTARFDMNHLALMGHSMGAWIAPLTASIEPRYRALVLSGAGGSFIANIIDKQKPIAPEVVVASLLDLPRYSDTPTYEDPALTILQWAAEPADPQVYGGAIPPATSILMEQGIVDHYILPSIADATSLSIPLALAQPAYDDGNAELASLGQPTLAPLLPLVGSAEVALPYAGAQVTRVVVQHPGDAIEDGHEVMFQTDPPKHQYRCFLASWFAGRPPLVAPDGLADAACP